MPGHISALNKYGHYHHRRRHRHHQLMSEGSMAISLANRKCVRMTQDQSQQLIRAKRAAEETHRRSGREWVGCARNGNHGSKRSQWGKMDVSQGSQGLH